MQQYGKNELEEKRTPKWLVYLQHREWTAELLWRDRRLQTRAAMLHDLNLWKQRGFGAVLPP